MGVFNGDLLVSHATLVTLGTSQQIVEDGAMLLRGGRIADLGGTAELRARYPAAEVLDAGGKIALPGMICAHTHFYGAFARGMALPGEPATNFVQILQRLWWRLDKTLTLDDVYYSALVCLGDAIRHGTTTLIDHHASPNAIEGSLDIIAQAVQQAGLRAGLCYEVTYRDGRERAVAGLRENERFIRSLVPSQDQTPPITNRKSEIGNRKSGLLAGMVGLHASLTLPDKTLEWAVGLAKDLGVGCHIHVAEDKADQQDSLKKSGLRVVERLGKAGVLGPRSIAAHCVQVDAFEVDILRQTGTWVVHNPRSNMNNAVGTAPVPAMLRRGIGVGLGNDGFSNDMFQELKVAYLLPKQASGDPRVLPAGDVLRLAVTNNAALAAAIFAAGTPSPFGTLAVGAHADVILLDYVPPTPLTAENFPWHLVFGMAGSHVDTTIVGGRVLMRGRQLLTLDEAAIAARARVLAQRLWARI
jgi:putative selenium metabolism protein SsnA